MHKVLLHNNVKEFDGSSASAAAMCSGSGNNQKIKKNDGKMIKITQCSTTSAKT